jgi:hypothetical protein
LETAGDEIKLVQFAKLKDMLIENINKTFDRDEKQYDDSKIQTDQQNNKRMHDTEGWKSLDTSMNCLKSLVEALGDQISNVDLLEVFSVAQKSV